MSEKVMDYETSESIAVSAIKKQISNKFSNNKITKGSSFVDLFENDRVHPEFYAFGTVDGVGSKVLLAQLLDKYDTVGIDCVAMNVNDAAVYGKIEPFLFVDYLACQKKIEEEKAGEIIRGIVTGLEQSNISEGIHNIAPINIAKGETASLDELIAGVKPGYGFDLAGALFGYIEKENFLHNEVINHKACRIGNKIVGFKSSGLHSNGFTAARHILLNGEFESRENFRKEYIGEHNIDEKLFGNGKKLGEILLEPTRIYSKCMADITKEAPYILGVNITGYGLKNFNRFGKNIMYKIKKPIEPHPIFEIIQEESGFSTEKMYTKFNMGMGFAAIVPENKVNDTINIAYNNGIEAEIIGAVVPGKGKPVTNLYTDEHIIPFVGY